MVWQHFLYQSPVSYLSTHLAQPVVGSYLYKYKYTNSMFGRNISLLLTSLGRWLLELLLVFANITNDQSCYGSVLETVFIRCTFPRSQDKCVGQEGGLGYITTVHNGKVYQWCAAKFFSIPPTILLFRKSLKSLYLSQISTDLHSVKNT